MNEVAITKEKIPDWRWQAVKDKNREFDGAFYFGVQTTGIFCRPSCSSKTPRRENVRFFANTDEAEIAGFRACLRCKPKNGYSPTPSAELIARAFSLLRSEDIEVATVEVGFTAISAPARGRDDDL